MSLKGNPLRRTADSKGISIIGGGDSLAAIQHSVMADKITYISTGSGVSLNVLKGLELPGVQHFRTNKKGIGIQIGRQYQVYEWKGRSK